MGTRFLIMLALVLLAGVGLAYLFSDIVAYLATSLVLSTIMKPAVNLLHHIEIFGQKMPRWVAVSITMLALVGGLVSGIVAVVPTVQTQVQDLSRADLTRLINKVSAPITNVERELQAGGVIKLQPGYFKKYLREITNIDVRKTDISTYVTGVIGFTSSIFVALLAISFMTFFLLLERGLLKRAFLRFVPNAYYELAVTAFYKIENLLSKYLIGLATQVTAIFILSAIGYMGLGMQYVFTVALFAALINVIPYIGPLVGNLTAVLVGISTTPGISESDYLPFGLQIFAVGIIVHLIDNVFLQPMIFSRNLKAHPLEIFVAIFMGSSLGGILGMVVAIPAYTVIRVSIQEIYAGYTAYRVFREKPKAYSFMR